VLRGVPCIMYQLGTSTKNCIKNIEHLTIIFCASSVAAHPGKDSQIPRQYKTVNKQY
jgi:sorbitol-specific phosphotransferase system component IIA